MRPIKHIHTWMKVFMLTGFSGSVYECLGCHRKTIRCVKGVRLDPAWRKEIIESLNREEK